MKLWIANIAPGTTDDEIKAFAKKYGPELEVVGIQREDGDGSRPAAGSSFPARARRLATSSIASAACGGRGAR